MPQRNRRQRLSGAGNVPGDLTSVHEGIPIRRHDASNNSSTAGKQTTSTSFVAQNSPRDIQPTHVTYNYTLPTALHPRPVVVQPVTDGYAGVAVQEPNPPYTHRPAMQPMVQMSPVETQCATRTGIYAPPTRAPPFQMGQAQANSAKAAKDGSKNSRRQLPRRDAVERNASETVRSSSGVGDAQRREERNRLRAMIFGQPLVEPQVATLRRVVAIDCEMVGVGPITGHKRRGGKQVSALARVSIVDFHGNIVLDAYVKPNEAVTDYRTSVSGIRPSDLSGEKAIPFAVAKAQVSHIFKGRIVVGHAIHYDLRALKLGRSHDPGLIRDTQACPEVKEKYGPSTIGLKKLCQHEFGVDMQPGEHSSVTDARATMALYHIFHGRWERDLRRAKSRF